MTRLRGPMKKITVVALSILGILIGAPLVSHAGPKNDGRPDGGTLGYGEYGRPSTLDPITSNEMVSLQFTLKRPILNALAKFSFKVIPKHGPSNPLYLTREDPFVQHPIGTGPYILKAITTDREIVLVANENYFKGRPHISRFISKPFADQNIMTQALMFNAIDMVVLVNPRDIPELQGDKRFILQPYNALSYAFFG